MPSLALPRPSQARSPILEALQRFSLTSRISKTPNKKSWKGKAHPALPKGRAGQAASPRLESSSGSRGGGGGSNSGNEWGGRVVALLKRRQEWAVITSLIVANIAVFAAWQFAHANWKDYGDPRLLLWMQRNFLAGMPNVDAGRWWTLLTCAFSQSEWGHFLVNLFTLTAMAPVVSRLVGPPSVLALYIIAGISTSAVSIMWGESRNDPQQRRRMSHGASGANYAILTTFACLRPTMDLLLFGVVPVPAWVFMTGIFAWDFYHAVYSSGGQTDNAGHVGGILTGFMYFVLRLRGRGI